MPLFGYTGTPTPSEPVTIDPTATTSYTFTDAILTTAPETGGFPVVAILSSGALDQIGISQTVSNGVNTISAGNTFLAGSGSMDITGGPGRNDVQC